MSHPFYIAVNKKKEFITRYRLNKQYPHLPVEIIDRVIETTSWHTLFKFSNTYITQVSLQHFYTMNVTIVEKICDNSIASIELFLLDKNRCSKERVKADDTELVKGIRSIPEGVFKMVMKSARALWNSS